MTYLKMPLQLQSAVAKKLSLDPIADGYESSYDCWELNSGPLEEQ